MAFSRFFRLRASAAPVVLAFVAFALASCDRQNRLVVTFDDEQPVVENAPVAEETPAAPSSDVAPTPSSGEGSASGAPLIFNDKTATLDLTGVAVFDGFESGADASRLEQVKIVRGSGAITVNGLRALANLPRLVEFLWLDAQFPNAPAAKDAFRLLIASAPKLKKVRLAGLKLENGKFPDYVLPALAAAPNLQEIDLSGSVLTTADLAPLGSSDAFPKLAKLTFYQTNVDDQGVEAILPLSDRLTWLNLDDTKITPQVATALERFANLTFLHVGRTTLDDSCVDSLVKLTKLEKIHVTRSNITESGADKLRAALPNCAVVSQPEN